MLCLTPKYALILLSTDCLQLSSERPSCCPVWGNLTSGMDVWLSVRNNGQVSRSQNPDNTHSSRHYNIVTPHNDVHIMLWSKKCYNNTRLLLCRLHFCPVTFCTCMFTPFTEMSYILLRSLFTNVQPCCTLIFSTMMFSKLTCKLRHRFRVHVTTRTTTRKVITCTCT